MNGLFGISPYAREMKIAEIAFGASCDRCSMPRRSFCLAAAGQGTVDSARGYDYDAGAKTRVRRKFNRSPQDDGLTKRAPMSDQPNNPAAATILICEDEVKIAEDINGVLRDLGYEVAGTVANR